jgi:aspartyl protease family protein
MLFIGFALVVAVALALLVSSDAGTLVGLTQQQAGQLVPLLILLIVFAGGAFARRRRASELIGNLALWVGLFGVAMLGYAYRDDLNGIAARVFGELMPGTAIVDSERGTATVRRGRDGHFQIEGKINGANITMIFDTGASAMVLTSADARKAGIDTARLQFNVPVSTANGTGRAASVVLDRIEIGSIVRERVRAFVAEAAALDTSLLGMSFLETLSRYAVSSNSLELTD